MRDFFRSRASRCCASATAAKGVGTRLETKPAAACRGSSKPRPAQDTKAGFHRCNPPVAMDPQGKDANSHRTHLDPRPRCFSIARNGVSAHDEATLVEIRPARFAAQFAKHLERLAFAFDLPAQRSGAFTVGPFATDLGPSPRQQRRRGMNRLSSARTPGASVPFPSMIYDPEPDFLPPAPKQPLPPAKQPTGPMPDQDHPPGEPHHMPEDPVAVPDEGDLLSWTPQALSRAALGARIP